MLDTKVHPIDIASGFRHAAANFTAFAFAQGAGYPLPTQVVVEELVRLLEAYDTQHGRKAPSMTNLERLVEQAKNE